VSGLKKSSALLQIKMIVLLQMTQQQIDQRLKLTGINGCSPVIFDNLHLGALKRVEPVAFLLRFYSSLSTAHFKMCIK